MKHNNMPVNWRDLFTWDLSFATRLLSFKTGWTIKEHSEK